MSRVKEITNKQKLVIVIIILVFLILAVAIMKKITASDGNKVIDYKNTNADQLISDSTISRDNAIYLSLNEIIIKYLNSYLEEDKENASKKEKYVNYKDYYSALVDRYKRFLSKGKYVALSQEFCERFLVKSENSQKSELDKISVSGYMDTKEILRNVYLFDENRYLCEVYSSKNDKKGYIGIELHPRENTWKIFYLE